MPRLNGVELHHETYAAERAATDLPAQLVCSARVKATEAIASCRTRARKGKKVSCPHSRRAAIRYDARSAKIHLAQGYATLATVSGRQRVALSIPPCHAGRVDLPVRPTSAWTARVGFGSMSSSKPQSPRLPRRERWSVLISALRAPP